MIVMKFGGTSVAGPENIRKVIEIVTRAHGEQDARAVVCSAFGGATDILIQLGDLAANRDDAYKDLLETLQKRHLDAVVDLVETTLVSETSAEVRTMLDDLADVLGGVYLLREISPRSRDFIMSFGERLCALIVSAALRTPIPDCAFLDARRVIRTDDAFGLARVDWDATKDKICNYFESHPGLQVVTGFIAATSDNRTTTLGRGGSDYTASLLGAALEVDEIQIWTDVSGVLTSDPRKVPEVYSVASMTYEEAMEIAHFGAKVIYPPTMAPAMNAGIPLRIKNTFAPNDPGTRIGKDSDRREGLPRAISSIDDVAMLQLKGSGLIGVAGVAGRLFGSLASAGVSVILISQASSEHAICFAVKPAEAEKARDAVAKEFAYEMLMNTVEPVAIELDCSVIAVVGAGMIEKPGVSGRIFAALGQTGINVDAIAQGSSELNISFIINRADEQKALRVLHEAFFEDCITRVYMVGYGLIGRTLMTQLHKVIHDKDMPNLVVCGVTNSRRMVFNREGLDLEQLDHELKKKGEDANLEAFMEAVKRRPGAVLVDNTAGDMVPAWYPDLLRSGISIVTPNKVAATADYATWTQLQELSARPGVAFLYEANVGAGLPVLSSLRTLIGSGDEVKRIQAVLSGTLSYLFNTYQRDMSFSELLRSAREKGFTEPDPRDDLGGMDVARKILILARECGLSLELSDIKVESLIPESCGSAGSVEEFFRALTEADHLFAQRLARAAEQGKVLRYVATLENGKAHVSLQAVGPDHPCYALSGADNLISFTTQRYNERPLAIIGPGAGADVTAAQVLAEILQLARVRSIH